MSNPRSVKIVDVAARAGVAPMTVSRVLNHPGQVAPETAERVRAAIDELGYVPNLIAGGLSSRRSRIVAAIVPTIATPIFATAIGAFTDRLDEAGYHVVLGLSGYAPGGEDDLIAAVLGRRPDGILLTGAAHSRPTERRLATAGIPVVEIWDSVERPVDMLVGFDHAALGAAAASHLFARGYRRFASMGADDPRAQARRRGFAVQAKALGGEVVFDAPMAAPASTQAGRDGLAAQADLVGDRIALFCSSDQVAAGALIEARRRGIPVPDRLGVCGFGDFDIAGAFDPGITTVAVDGGAIGTAAAECLLQRLAGHDAPARVDVPFRIIQRQSA